MNLNEPFQNFTGTRLQNLILRYTKLYGQTKPLPQAYSFKKHYLEFSMSIYIFIIVKRNAMPIGIGRQFKRRNLTYLHIDSWFIITRNDHILKF